MLLEICAGIIVGPYVLGFLDLTDELNFLREIGIVFLLFLVGMEFRLGNWRETFLQAIILSIPSVIISMSSFLLAFIWLDFSMFESLVLGLVLGTTSISITFPILKFKLGDSDSLYNSIVLAGMLKDIAIVTLAGLLSNYFGNATSSVLVFVTEVIVILLFVLVIYLIVSQRVLEKMNFNRLAELFDKDGRYYWKTKYAIGILGLILLVGTILDIESAVVAFFAGVLINSTANLNTEEKERLNVLGWGIFIPIFFFITGMRINVLLLDDFEVLSIVVLLFLVAVLGKIIVSLFILRPVVSSFKRSFITSVGFSTLSISLGFAVLSIGLDAGLIDADVFSIIGMLVIIADIFILVVIEFVDKFLQDVITDANE